MRSFHLSLVLGAAVLAAAPAIFAGADASARERGPIDFVRKASRAYERDANVASARIPAWLDSDPTVVQKVDAAVLENNPNHPVTMKDGVATASLERPNLTWMSKFVAIPPQSKACVTVYIKFHEDFKPGDGGKLPGLANTGQGRPNKAAPEIIDGEKYPNSAWGGRKSDGVHWSARTGYGGWTDDRVSIHTYFYANTLDGKFRSSNPLGSLKKGSWTAYVECLKLNTPGKPDGGLFYETVEDGPVLSRDDIPWREIDAPETMIREMWIDVFCGGTNCGPNPRGTVSFAGAVITKGLPDMKAIKAEVARLNAQ